MKTAVSLPDDLHQKADKLARRLKMSRSQLYQEALEKYIQDYDEAGITERLNSFFENETSTQEVNRQSINKRLFAESEW